jgi:hypothetical protein
MQPTLAALAALLCATLVIAPLAPAPPSTVQYTAGTTLVVKEQFSPPRVDDGVVVCTSSGVSVGGGCLPFGPFSGIAVNDAMAGTTVAYQVCIDNNGDRACTFDRQDPCADDLYFSHDDDGNFFLPVGPLRQGFRPGCNPGGAFPGYIVFLCQAVHVPREPPGPPHSHLATQGTITGVQGGAGSGNFCLPTGFQTKTYVLA